MIIDEFPYLVTVTPAVPSYLQQALSPMGNARQRARTRMVLCGSALTTMAQLLGGGAPLRGRARLELVVRRRPAPTSNWSRWSASTKAHKTIPAHAEATSASQGVSP